MRRAAFTLVLACLLLTPAGALASSTQESMFQDDNLLEFAPAAEVAKTLDRLKGLGVDRVRVSVFWGTVAPASSDSHKPKGFDGADPDAYQQAKWERYDTLVTLAAARGIGVMWDVTGPSPNWATGTPQRKDLDDAWYPNASEFADFVRALGTRYSGTFIRPGDRPKTTTKPGKGVPGLPGYQPPTTVTTKAGPPLARVDTWEIWNEPNQGAWLAPQSTVHKVNGTRQWIPTSPQTYRKLADAMYGALYVTGHGGDTILLGATAPKGSDSPSVSHAMKPELFIRELFCVDPHNEAYRGNAAKIRGCPTSDPINQVPKQHPVLFKATGFAHHPYELTFAPNHRPPDPAYYTIANLGSLSRTLRLAYLRFKQPVPSSGIPLWLTEFGYQTNPPDRIGVSLTKQAQYLDQAEYMVWRNRAVRALSQFLLVDGGAPVSLTFQTGLMFLDGRAKPSLNAYRLPIWLPKRRFRAHSLVRVWGLARPAPNGTAPTVTIQFRRPHGSAWKTVATTTGSADRGYVYKLVRLPGTGRVRMVWNAHPSRSVTVTVTH
ncbi:MAG: hypothetical protein QOG68_1862 [Solirubrobacteraceae bacterium]|nr:hypothetical protein [Solirubrobacteraceae bacterium]